MGEIVKTSMGSGMGTAAKINKPEEITEENNNVNIEMQVDNGKVENE